MDPREELAALRRLAELEAKAGGMPSAPQTVQSAPQTAKAPAGMQTMADMGGAIWRGAGSIGSTFLAPMDMLNAKLTGRPLMSGNQERREGMDAGLTELGVNTNSLPFKGTKLLTEIAGTAAAGPALAGLGTAALTRAAPALLPKAAPFLDAVGTAGMRAGGVTGKAGMGLRTAGGGVTGAAAAGLVNPEDTAAGGVIGAALPGALRAVGAAGGAAGRVLRGAEQSPELASAVGKAREAGYVIPPTQARPSLGNRIMEGFSGKITTQQNASAKNQAVTNKLAAKAIGLPEDAPITTDALDAVRAEAGKAYGEIARLGKFNATGVKLPKSVAVENGISPLLAGKTQSVDAGELVRAWKQANADATAYFRAYGRDASPETLAKAKAAAADAKQIDDFMVKRVSEIETKRPAQLIADFVSGKLDQSAFIEQSMTVGSKKKMTEALKEARVRIAKTYSVEGAMNPLTGTVDARKLAKQLEKGKMLSGDLLSAAEFAGRFPRAAQTTEGMGSLPQTSPLDWIPAGALSMATSNPLMMAGVAARPAARAATLSPMVQNRLIQQPRGPAFNALQSPELQQFLLRGSPVAISSGGR